MKVMINEDELLVQYLVAPLGLREKDILAWAPAILIGETELKVMHPMHCMMSRIVNTGPPLHRKEEDELKRVRASVVCARLWLQEELENGQTKAALKQEKATFEFARSNQAALAAFAEYQVDAYDSIPDDPRFPEKYLSENRPRRLAQLKTRRHIDGVIGHNGSAD